MYLSRVDLRAGEGVVVGTHLDLFPPTVLLGVDGCRLLASLSLASRDFRLPTVDLGQMFSLMKLCTRPISAKSLKSTAQSQGQKCLGTRNTKDRSKSRFFIYISESGFYGTVRIICSQFDIGLIGWNWPIFEGASPRSIHNTHSACMKIATLQLHGVPTCGISGRDFTIVA